MQDGKAKLVISAFLILLLGVVSFAQETTDQVRVGKEDDITLSSVTKVGTLTLWPGYYILRHKTSHEKHAMHFVSFIPYGGIRGHGRTYYPAGYSLPSSRMGRFQVGEVECKLEPLNAKVKRTQVVFAEEHGAKRITRIEIRGENVAHLF